VIGILSAFEVYAAQLLWPATQPFPNVDTAFLLALPGPQAPFCHRWIHLLVANFAPDGRANRRRPLALPALGRSKALPQSFFGVVDPKRHVPRNNVFFVGAIALAGALLVSIGLFSYGLGAEMLNFGALIAFQGVETWRLSSALRRRRRQASDPPWYSPRW